MCHRISIVHPLAHEKGRGKDIGASGKTLGGGVRSASCLGGSTVMARALRFAFRGTRHAFALGSVIAHALRCLMAQAARSPAF